MLSLTFARARRAATAPQAAGGNHARTCEPDHVGAYLLAVLLFCAYAGLSITRHLRLRSTGYDLGIFEQAVRAYAELRAPVAELKGPGYNLLGDHFHPLLAALAPAYRIWPSPVTLLIVQALLFALSAVPVTRLAIGSFGLWPGLALGFGYGLAWGVQTAVEFDFHEICLAMVPLALCLERLVMHRWGGAAAYAVPLILVKEELTLTVAAVGAYLFVRGQRRLGIALCALGLIAFLMIYFLIIPWFNPSGEYAYLANVTSGGDPVARLLTSWRLKLVTLAVLLVPTAFLALRSPIVLIAAPIMAIRFWSDTSNHWAPGFQYNAIPALIISMALIDALRTGRMRRPWMTRLAAIAGVTVTLAMLPAAPLHRLTQATTWQTSQQAATARRLLSMIPDGATVSADNRLAPQLTSRTRVFRFPAYPRSEYRPEWVVIFDHPEWMTLEEYRQATRLMALLGYTPVAHQDGIKLFHRQPDPAAQAPQSVGVNQIPAERVSLADLRAGSNTLQILGFPGVVANINVYVDPAWLERQPR